MKEPRLSKAETRILEQFWKLGTASVREILESLPEDERVAYTTVQTLVYRLEEKGALRKVKKIGNAQLFQPAINESQYRSRLVGDLLDLFGGSPRLLVSNLLENGALTLRDLKSLQSAARSDKNGRTRGGKRAWTYRTRDVLLQRPLALYIHARTGRVGADDHPWSQRYHEILDLGCDRIQFRAAGRSIHRQALGAALDLGHPPRGYWWANMGYD